MAMASADVYDTALKLAGHPRNVITSEINGPGDNCVYYFAEDYHQQYLAKPGARYVLGLSQSQTQFAAPGRGATIIQRKCTTGNSFKYITRRLFYRSW